MSRVGDNMDIHHVPQKHPASQVVEGYDPSKAPSIVVPAKEHRKIPTMKGDYSGSPRDILAKDIKDLREHTDAPNSSLKELIDMNKKMYPKSYNK